MSPMVSRHHNQAGQSVRTLLVFLACLATVTHAQEQPAEAAAESPQVVAPSPERAGEALREIERLAAALQDEAVVAQLRLRTEAAQQQLRAEVEDRLDATTLDQIDQRRLDGMRLTISRQRASLSEIGTEVASAIGEISSVLDSLRSVRETWSGLLGSAEQEEMPQELVRLVERIVGDASTSLELARARLGELVAVETSVLELSNRLESFSSAVEARERALLSDILRKDTQPLWLALRQLSIAESIGDFSTLSDEIRVGLSDLADTYGIRVFGQIAAGLLVLFLFLTMRKNPQFQSQIEQSSLQRILDHPVALTVVLTLAVSQPLYPTAQPSVIVLNTTLFIIAELVVIGAAVPIIGWKALSLAGAYLILMRIVYLLPYATPLHQVLMLAGAIGGILLLAATWRLGNSRDYFGRLRNIVGFILSALGALLLTTVVAGVIGYVGYASFVVEAVLRCYLAALGLLTISIVIRDVVDVLLVSRFARALRSVRQNRESISLLLKRWAAVVAVILWGWAVLNAFRILDPFLGVVGATLSASWTIGEVSTTPGTVLVFVLSVWLAVYLSRVVRFFLDNDVLPRLDLPRGVPAAVSTGFHYLIISGALLFGTAAAGLDLTKLAIVVGALSVGIGFGLQNVVNNFISGLILLFERPIQAGDHVRVGELMGTVSRIGIRASTVRMYEGSEVIVPNGDLISQQVINFTLSDRNRRLEVNVGVAYGTNTEKARDAITDAVNSVALVRQDPPAQVLFSGFGDSSLDFRILFWIDNFEDGLRAMSEVGMAIGRQLELEGIVIPFPQRDLHFQSALPPDRPDTRDHDRESD